MSGSVKGTGASRRYEHPEVAALADAVESAFRGVRRDMDPLLPAAEIHIVHNGPGAADIEVGNPLGRTISRITPVMVSGQDIVGYHLKTNSARKLVVHVQGAFDVVFLVR